MSIPAPPTGRRRGLLDEIVCQSDLEEVAGRSLLRRDGLVPFYESIGFERFDTETEVPEGGTDEPVRMMYAPGE